MEAISLKLPPELVESAAQHAKALGISRAEYMRRAIARMNREAAAATRARRLARVSRKVRGETMRVNAEFAAVEHDPDA
jgi:predicted transcriptional regulator